MNEFERTCKYNDMLFEIEEVITNCCQNKYPAEYVDDAISVLTDVYECRKDCDVTIVDAALIQRHLIGMYTPFDFGFIIL